MREKSFIQKTVHTLTNIFVLIALAWFIVHSFLTTVEISGHSMEPGLSSGEIALVDTLKYKFLKPSRLDVVIFQKNDSTENIKRVVGLPGETVVIQNGRIYINGTLLESDKISNISLAGIAEKPVQLMEDEYFLIGDNADSSEDSRFINVGNVHKSQITGKVWFILLPLDKINFVK
ncbi:signal peptidase I [Oribacterium sp. WCC10]|uniref:signal peptidase I n=1 Tax=Oribacterium sp. WCC10 TaxID=1855343 RepID=UPI0008EE0242|nr:signal peptidase I [Oribacterium sp. WCC10]SFG08843.1 signal peptidase I [Oribacterium sp. WCC10]